MTVTRTEQYRINSQRVTAQDDPLSVPQANRLADGINNAKAHAMAHKLHSRLFWPCLFSGDSADTSERVVAVLCPIRVPHGYTKGRIWLLGAKSSGTKCTAKVYSHGDMYNGPAVLDVNKLTPDYQVEAFEFTSTSWTHLTTDRLPLVFDAWWRTWTVITMTNAASSRGFLVGFQMAPRMP